MDNRPWFARPCGVQPSGGERKRGPAVQCSPLVVSLGLLLVAAAYIGAEAVPAVLSARSEIMAVLRDVAAVALVLAAAGLLAAMTRRLAAHEGQHTSVLPGDEPEPVTAPRKPAKAAEPAAPAEAGTYTWRIKPAEAAAMAADADAFADIDTGVVVSEHGDIYELAGPPREDEA